MGGIYRIINILTGKIYIGSAVNFAERWRLHVLHLNKKSHKNRHLQSAWDKYGAENFKFEKLEPCERNNLIEREQFYIDKFEACKNGYNLSPTAGNSSGVVRSEEMKKRIAQTLTGRHGTPWTEERRKKASEFNKGKVLSEEHRRKLSIANKGKVSNRKGAVHTEESKKKMSISQRKRIHKQQLRLAVGG